jgi:hypothetical protein
MSGRRSSAGAERKKPLALLQNTVVADEKLRIDILRRRTEVRHCKSSHLLQKLLKPDSRFWQVTLLLLPGAPPGRQAVRLLLDQEPQRPGEGEVQTALRLLARVIPAYPRAFTLVLADALYAQTPFSIFSWLMANTCWSFSRMNDAICTRMWRDCSTT